MSCVGSTVMRHKECGCNEDGRVGVVALGDGGQCWSSGPCATKNVGGMRRVGAGIVALGDESHVLFSGPEPQKNVGGARVVVLGDGGHVWVLRACATKECQ
ncbi:hypothetical protein TNCV_3709101, partial [Trichonephila clavipes]